MFSSIAVIFTAGCTYQDQLKQCSLVHLQELLVPNRNVVRSFLLVFIVLRGWRVVFVMSAPLNHLWDTNTSSLKQCAVTKQRLRSNNVPCISILKPVVGKLFDWSRHGGF